MTEKNLIFSFKKMIETDWCIYQFVGERGVGKSSLINAILEKLGNSERAFVNSVEATLETAYYDITQGLRYNF